MTVGDLRDALAMFEPSTVVVVASGGEWTRVQFVGSQAVNLGRCVERVATVNVDVVPREEEDGNCPRCDRLEAAIDEARSALEGVA